MGLTALVRLLALAGLVAFAARAARGDPVEDIFGIDPDSRERHNEQHARHNYQIHLGRTPLADLTAALNHDAAGPVINGVPLALNITQRLANLDLLGGLFDAEGSVAWGAQTLYVSFSANNPSLLAHIQSVVGGEDTWRLWRQRTSPNAVLPGLSSNGNLNWVLIGYDDDAAQFLCALLPHLRLKHQKVSVGVSWFSVLRFRFLDRRALNVAPPYPRLCHRCTSLSSGGHSCAQTRRRTPSTRRGAHSTRTMHSLRMTVRVWCLICSYATRREGTPRRSSGNWRTHQVRVNTKLSYCLRVQVSQ